MGIGDMHKFLIIGLLGECSLTEMVTIFIFVVLSKYKFRVLISGLKGKFGHGNNKLLMELLALVHTQSQCGFREILHVWPWGIIL